MSSTVDQFPDNWNRIFSFKILDADLKRPTEQFLFGALKCYLISVNVNVPKLMQVRKFSIFHQLLIYWFPLSLKQDYNYDLNQPPNTMNNLRFRIKFCAYINEQYKISNKSNNFLYYDLIRPGEYSAVVHHMVIYILQFHFLCASFVGSNKTIHLLKSLLNFYMYYAMVRKEVVESAQQTIAKYHATVKHNNDVIVKNENDKTKKANVSVYEGQ